MFVIRMLMRDLFAVANLLVFTKFIVFLCSDYVD